MFREKKHSGRESMNFEVRQHLMQLLSMVSSPETDLNLKWGKAYLIDLACMTIINNACWQTQLSGNGLDSKGWFLSFSLYSCPKTSMMMKDKRTDRHVCVLVLVSPVHRIMPCLSQVLSNQLSKEVNKDCATFCCCNDTPCPRQLREERANLGLWFQMDRVHDGGGEAAGCRHTSWGRSWGLTPWTTSIGQRAHRQ